MEYVANHEWGEQRSDDFFLQRGLSGEIPGCCAKEAEVDEAEKAADVGELHNRHLRRERQPLRGQNVRRPRRLHIMGLQVRAPAKIIIIIEVFSRGEIEMRDEARTFVGSRSAPMKPNNVTNGS
jgi:hypothetical protein